MTRNKTKSNKPSHTLFHVTGEGDNARWNKIGAGWAHEDNGGMSLKFEYLPAGTQGRLVIRKAKTTTTKTVEG